MELTIIGSGTCAPVPHRTPACYLVEADGVTLLVDPGPGAVNRIVAAGGDPLGVDAIVVSHFHLDHISDLLYWLFAYKYCQTTPRRSVTLFGPPGFASFFEAISGPVGKWVFDDRQYKVTAVELAKPVTVGPITITAADVVTHSPESRALKFSTDSVSLVYSGDTGYDPRLATFATGVDGLLIECSMPDGWEGEGHLTPAAVAKIACDAGPRRLILTHLHHDATADQLITAVATHGYEGEVTVAYDGLVIDLS